MKLNVGCGRIILDGYVNVDALGGDLRADVCHLPFKETAFDFVLASHSLEHIQDLNAAMREIHRVLKPGGFLMARVPYGLRGLLDPFHHHAFDFTTLMSFCRNDEGSLEYAPFFAMREQNITDFFKPIIGDRYRYYIERYLSRLASLVGVRMREDRRLVFELPLGPRKEITAIMERLP